jgi:hypothetical protein
MSTVALNTILPATNGRVLPDLAQANTQRMDDIATQIAALKAENAALKAAAKAETKANANMRISEKGALSVYGLGRFPVTLYRGQWERLLDRKEAILTFIDANASALATKQD